MKKLINLINYPSFIPDVGDVVEIGVPDVKKKIRCTIGSVLRIKKTEFLFTLEGLGEMGLRILSDQIQFGCHSILVNLEDHSASYRTNREDDNNRLISDMIPLNLNF